MKKRLLSRKSVIFVLIASAILFSVPTIQACSHKCSKDGHKSFSEEQLKVKEAIVEAYIKGIKIERDTEKIRKGFHPAFNMFALRDGNIRTTTIDKWIEGIEKGKAKYPDRKPGNIEYKFPIIDITENVAIAKIEVYKDSKHQFSDYMSLYKFEEGWRIVSKVYYMHPK